MRTLMRLPLPIRTFALLACAFTSQAATFTFTTLPVGNLANAYNRSGLSNNSSLLVGIGYRYNAGTVTPLGSISGLPSQTAQLAGIDDSGNLSGFYYNGNGYSSFYQSGGSNHDISIQNATDFFAAGMSGNGKVTGWYTDSFNRQQIFTESGGTVSTVTVPGGAGQPYAWDINNSGDLVGLTACCRGGRSFIKQGASYTTIHIAGQADNNVFAYGLNDNDDVVGWYSATSSSPSMGFLWKNGVVTTINVPGAANTELFDINDSGTIFGSYTDAQNNQFNFLATQDAETPEPATFYLLGGGLLCAFGVRARRRRSS